MTSSRLPTFNYQWDNFITDVGLAQLARLPELRLVEVGDTHVTDEGIRKLAAALPKAKVRPLPK